MTTFFQVLGIVVVVVLSIALTFGPLLVGIGLAADGRGWWWAPTGVVVAVIFAAIFATIGINSGFLTDDNASHCGAGTRYIHEAHYDPATKTSITEWMCTI